jgi:hypothetical protein
MSAATACVAPKIENRIARSAGGDCAHRGQRLGIRTGDVIVEIGRRGRGDVEHELLHR